MMHIVYKIAKRRVFKCFTVKSRSLQVSHRDLKIKAFRFGFICICWCVCFHWPYNFWELKAVVLAVLGRGFKNIRGWKKMNLGVLKWNLHVLIRLPSCSSSCSCSTLLRFGSHAGLTGRQPGPLQLEAGHECRYKGDCLEEYCRGNLKTFPWRFNCQQELSKNFQGSQQ